MTCIFCDIVSGKAPSKIVYQDERAIIFKDHMPKANIHLMICPKAHYATFLDAPADEVDYILDLCRRLARKLGVENGFRLQINNGPESGQIVYHLHIHFMSWIGQVGDEMIDLRQ